MAVDVSQFELRGALWYRRGGGKTPYEWKACESCGKPALIKRRGQCCSRSCARQHQTGSYRAQEDAAYSTWHSRVRAARGPASGYACADCGNPAEEWSLADASSHDVLARFQPRCIKCHRKFDNHGAAIRGEDNPITRLTDNDVREIRARYEAGSVTQRELGIEFGVSESTIRHIVQRDTWKHI